MTPGYAWVFAWPWLTGQPIQRAVTVLRIITLRKENYGHHENKLYKRTALKL